MRTFTKNLFKRRHFLLALVLLTLFSCKRDDEKDLNNLSKEVPENVDLAKYTSSSITVSWDSVKGATSYYVQLMGTDDPDDKPLNRYIVIGENSYTFDGLGELSAYYVRVRANLNTIASEWVYIMDGSNPGRIIPRYGIVEEDFEPEPEPVLYPGFPEGWEVHEGGRKSAYAGNKDAFPSGEWLMPNMYSISVASITNKIGDWAMLLRGGVAPYLEMNFDLPEGASLLSFYYGAATQNATDQGGLPIYVTVDRKSVV